MYRQHSCLLFRVDNQKTLWASDCLNSWTMEGTGSLEVLTTPFSVHNKSKVDHWTSSFKLFTCVRWDLPGEMSDGDDYFLGVLCSQWEVAIHQHVAWNLSNSLILIANETANFLTSLHKFLDFLAKVVSRPQSSLRLCFSWTRRYIRGSQLLLLYLY